MRLRPKLLLLIIPLVILPVLTLGWIAYGELRSASEQQLFSQMKSALRQLDADLRDTLTTAEANIGLFANNNLLVQYAVTDDEEQRYALLHAPLLRVFQQFQSAFPEYYEIRILLTDGYEDIRRVTGVEHNATDQEHESYAFIGARATGGRIFSRVLRNPDNNEHALYVIKPLILRDPRVDALTDPPILRGYLSLTVSLDSLHRRVHTHSIGESGYLFASTAEHEFIVKPNIVMPTRGMPHSAETAAHQQSLEHPPALTWFNGKETYLQGITSESGLHLYAALPLDEFIALRTRLGLYVFMISLVTILGATGLLYLAMDSLMIRPIQKLRNMSREIGRGKLDVTSELRRADELGELGQAFSDMAKNLQQSSNQVRYIAYHDNLTGLPNRTMFQEYLEQVIAHARRNDQQFALLFLDLDDFKRVNDTLGHQAGDELLQEITQRLNHCLRRSDAVVRLESEEADPSEMLARLGGDEFVILLPDLKDAQGAGVLARRLIQAMREPVCLDESEFIVSASIGITVFPDDGDNVETLVKNADIAMYHAKGRGKNDYNFFQDSMNQLAHERLTLETKLRKALDNSELSLHYQPKVDARSGDIVGLEALLRWNHPEEGLISPTVFIPVAEETGLILAIGEWVLYEACRQNRAWQRAGLRKVPVAVNISGIQFARQEVPNLIRAALELYTIEPRYLEVEITESAIMVQPEHAIEDLNAIKDLGVRIALDDFGTGYSSFSYLHRFPIDVLKIDRSFVKDIGEATHNEEIVAAMIAMAHILKMEVVAEGIETPQQGRILAQRGCDTLQGFLIARPMPADEIPRLLSLNGNLKRALQQA